jgi:hypothetical protein
MLPFYRSSNPIQEVRNTSAKQRSPVWGCHALCGSPLGSRVPGRPPFRRVPWAPRKRLWRRVPQHGYLSESAAASYGLSGGIPLRHRLHCYYCPGGTHARTYAALLPSASLLRLIPTRRSKAILQDNVHRREQPCLSMADSESVQEGIVVWKSLPVFRSLWRSVPA